MPHLDSILSVEKKKPTLHDKNSCGTSFSRPVPAVFVL